MNAQEKHIIRKVFSDDRFIDPGFYSKYFTRSELQEVSDALNTSLNSEISLIRTMLKRLFAAAREAGEDFEQSLNLINVLGLTCIRLSRLIEANRAMQMEKETQIHNALNLALSDIVADWQRASLGDEGAVS